MKPLVGLLLAACASAGAQVSLLAEAAPPRSKGGVVLDDDRSTAPLLSPQNAETLARINALRAAGATCGSRRMDAAPPLQWNEALQRAAEVQARDIAARQTVGHDGSDGSTVAQRVDRQGYEWRALGENAAAGKETVLQTLQQWLESPGHCVNLMGPQFREVAVFGVNRPGTTFNWYWVMVLATRMNAPR